MLCDIGRLLLLQGSTDPFPDGKQAAGHLTSTIDFETRPCGKTPWGDGWHAILLVWHRAVTCAAKSISKEIVVPESVFPALHAQADLVASCLSISGGSALGISSLPPHVIAVAQDADVGAIVPAEWNVQLPDSKIIPEFHERPSLELVLKCTGDRAEGLLLLDECTRESSAISKVRAAYRIFERAFSCAAKVVLVNQLPRFLLGTRHEFTHKECEQWLNVRDRLTHADRPHEPIWFESDVRRIAPRVIDAAFDVVFNKKSWHDPTFDRRSLWSPTFGSKGPNADLFGTVGGTPKMQFQLLDPFGRYPCVIASIPADEDWICSLHAKGTKAGGTITISEDPKS